MKKTLVALLLTATMLAPTVCAYTDEQVNTADALNNLELFLGNGVDYNLDGKLSRAEGVTLLVRMIGQEKTANSYDYTAPFVDVPSWASAYVNYAWLNSITNGVSGTEFGSDVQMDEYMFLTLTLRMLGYKDSGENPEFTWDHPYELAKKVGLISKNAIDSNFTRGDAISVFWNALTLNDNALAKDLISRGVFTLDEFNEAVDVKLNGRDENVGVPLVPGAEDNSQNDGDDVVVVAPGNDESDTNFDDTTFEEPDDDEPDNDKPDNDEPNDNVDVPESGNDGDDDNTSDSEDTGNNNDDSSDSSDHKTPQGEMGVGPLPDGWD